MANNLFTYISFPTKAKRKEYVLSYFDTQNLFLDLQKFLELNGLTKNVIVKSSLDEGDFEIINNDIREKIRRFNNNIFYLTMSIFNMCNYYDKLKASSGDDAIVLEQLFRFSARNVCCEMFMYEEKIKNLIRCMYDLDKKKTKSNSTFIKELERRAKDDKYLKEFYDYSITYNALEEIKFVKDIRDDEIHNDSPLDEYIDTIKLDSGIISCTPFHKISNSLVYNQIQKALKSQSKLKGYFQVVLDNFKYN